MKRSTRRRIQIGIGIYFLVAVGGTYVTSSVVEGRSFTGEDGWGPQVITLAMFGLIGYGVYRFRVRPRTTAGQVDASRLELRHADKDRFGLRDLPFGMLDRLASPWRIGNVLWGRWEGFEVTIFDVWSTGRHYGPAGQPGQPGPPGPGHEYRCVLTSFPAAWPTLVVEPERLATQFADALSLRDIGFESEEFNRRFEVRCLDPRFATALLDARMVAWLLSLGDEWGFETNSGMLLAYTPLRAEWDPTEVLVTVRTFLENVPEVAYSLYPTLGMSVVTPPPPR